MSEVIRPVDVHRGIVAPVTPILRRRNAEDREHEPGEPEHEERGRSNEPAPDADELGPRHIDVLA